MRIIYILIALPVLFISCIGNKKLSQAKEQLADVKQQHDAELEQLKTVDKKTADKLSEGKIDSNIKAIIEKRVAGLQTVNDSVQTKIDSLEKLLTSKKEARKNYKKIIIPMLDSLQQANSKYGERLTVYMMVQDALDVSDFKLFDLAAFFGPGKYAIPEDKIELAGQSFSPIIDSLLQFSNKYKDVPKTATLLILGFADGAGFDPASELHSTLLSLIGKTEATKQELNFKLSELRAKELITQLTSMYVKKVGISTDDRLKVVYLGQGKGEEYPLPTIKDYQEDDERRRIVLCYWVVLPD
jgi:outer membrane protein OmpA-like peptidoglycan-associated protein